MKSLQNDRHVALSILTHALCWQIIEGEAVFDVVIGGVCAPQGPAKPSVDASACPF